MNLQHLIQQCSKSDLSAQRQLYELYAGKLFVVCRRYMKTKEDAEEMVLNGLLKAFTALPHFQYRTESGFWSWIKIIAVNECLMQLRKRENFFLLAEPNEAEANAEESVLEKLSADEIYALITRLPMGYRTVFNLYVVEGYSHQEIAGLLGITEGTSKSQLNRARGLLQQLIIQNDRSYAREKRK